MEETIYGGDGLVAHPLASKLRSPFPHLFDCDEVLCVCVRYKKSSALARFLPRISSGETLGTGPSDVGGK